MFLLLLSPHGEDKGEVEEREKKKHTLSVSMVAISSPSLTKSPLFLIHCFNVPSVMDSAIWGTCTFSHIASDVEKERMVDETTSCCLLLLLLRAKVEEEEARRERCR